MGLWDRFKKKDNTERNKEERHSIEQEEKESSTEEYHPEKYHPEKDNPEKEDRPSVPSSLEASPVLSSSEASPVPSSPKASPELQEAVANEGRRFVLLVEDTSLWQEDGSVVVTGTVHGYTRTGDAVYILHPGKAVTLSEIDEIKLGSGEIVGGAKEQQAELRLDKITDKTQIPKFSVLTSIRPQTAANGKQAVENPYVLGLSYEYSRFYKEQLYLNLLAYEVAHGHYLVPMYLNEQDGKTAGFPMLKHPGDPNQNVLPVFTDWTALHCWKTVFDEKHPPRTMILQFGDCAAVVKKSGAGMVINSFGPKAVFLPVSLIDSILHSEGYQKEFGPKTETKTESKTETKTESKTETKTESKTGTGTETEPQSARQEKEPPIRQENEKKIMLGVPKETNEVKLIREGLVTCGERNREISRIDLFLKVDEKKERAYLCVVDCPAEQEKQIFRGIYDTIRAFTQEIRRVEFIRSERAGFMKAAMEKSVPVYRSSKEKG